MAKYHSRKFYTRDGIKHDSTLEGRRWEYLKEQQGAGNISNLRRQIPFELIPKTELIERVWQPGRHGGKGRWKNSEMAVKYVADFVYIKDGRQIVEDTKGFKTADYIIKRKLMLSKYKIQIREISKWNATL